MLCGCKAIRYRQRAVPIEARQSALGRRFSGNRLGGLLRWLAKPAWRQMVRIQPGLLATLDSWIVEQDIAFTRPEAIRRLIEIALSAKSKRQSNRGEK